LDRYTAYVEARKWVCEESPTGAHHWMIGRGHEGVSHGQCVYCRARRKFDIRVNGECGEITLERPTGGEG